MSLNPEFKPLDGFYKDENKLGKPDVPVVPFPSEQDALLTPNQSKSIEPQGQRPSTDGTPSFGETLGNAFLQYNEFVQAGRFLNREAQFIHPFNDDVPDNWTPISDELLNYPAEYHGWLAEAESPLELQARQNYVMQDMDEKERLADGSIFAQLLGGFAGAALSPTNAIPITSSIKLSKISSQIIGDVAKAAPGLSAQALLHEGFVQSTETADDMQNFAVNAVRDMAFGGAFVAAGAGLGRGMRGAGFWATRKLANYHYEGVDINPVINEKGEVTSYKASAAAGMNVSSAKVTEAQAFLDSAMTDGNYFGLPIAMRLAGNKALGSPIVRGMTHKVFSVIPYMTERLAQNSFVTEGVMAGRAKPTSAETILAKYEGEAYKFSMSYKGHFYAENGIEGGYNFRNAAKAFTQRMSQGNPVSYKEFGARTMTQLFTDQFTDTRNINQVAKEARNAYDETYTTFRKLRGLSEDFYPSKDAAGYSSIQFNDSVRTRGDEFIQIAANNLKQQDEMLINLMNPLNEAKALLKKLEDAKLTGQFENRSLANEILEARQRVRQIRQDLERRARDDQSVRRLLSDVNFLTSSEAEELATLFKPHDEALELKSKLEKDLAVKKSEYSKAKSKAKVTKTKKGTDKNLERMRVLESEMAVLDKQIADAARKAENHLTDLENRAHAGEINSRLFYKDENTIKFRDHNEINMFRDPFESDDARIAHVRQFRERILNESAEQVHEFILQNVSPSAFGSPLKKRTALIDPLVLLNGLPDSPGGFLETDLTKVMLNYQKTFGRHIGLMEAFHDLPRQGDEDVPAALARTIKEQYNKLQDNLEKDTKLSADEKQKRKAELSKEFGQQTEFMKNMLDAYFGRSGSSKTALRVSRALKSFAAMTKLGGVPIAQLTDQGAIAMKHGMWSYFYEGLAPLIKSLQHNGISEEMKLNAADAGLAYEHVADAYGKYYQDIGVNSFVPVNSQLESAIDTMSHVSGNLFGINSIENMNQRIVSTIMQSKVMRLMHKELEGTLTPQERESLLIYGLDPKEWATRFTEAFKESGGYKDGQAYFSKYYNWKDVQASNKMAETLRRGVYDTVVQSGMFTSPFWARNPIISSMMMFHGWAFAAFSAYTVPLIQRPNAQKLMGMGIMLAIGAMIDPLRNIANGKPYNADDSDTWFGSAFNAVSNSGIMGHTADILQVANKMVDGALLPQMSVKYQGINKLGAIMGPIGGMGQDLASVVHMGLTGKINEAEFKKGLRLLPYSSMIGVRYLLNTFAESLDLPETRSQAEPYSWRQ